MLEDFGVKPCPDDYDYMLCPDLDGRSIKLFGRTTEDDTNTAKGKVFYLNIARCTPANK